MNEAQACEQGTVGAAGQARWLRPTHRCLGCIQLKPVAGVAEVVVAHHIIVGDHALAPVVACSSDGGGEEQCIGRSDPFKDPVVLIWSRSRCDDGPRGFDPGLTGEGPALPG
jgi:hypothetical protein